MPGTGGEVKKQGEMRTAVSSATMFLMGPAEIDGKKSFGLMNKTVRNSGLFFVCADLFNPKKYDKIIPLSIKGVE